MDLRNIKTNFKNSSNSDLINYIFKKHHAFLKQELSNISDEALRVYEIYFEDDGSFLEEVHSVANHIITNLEAHMIKEEKTLFINIKEYDRNPNEDLLEEIIEGIESVEKNNNEIQYGINELRRVTDGYTKGLDKHTGYSRIYKMLKELERETKAHLELERELIHRRIKGD